jgi:molybdenum cofactor guanylyltransferase
MRSEIFGLILSGGKSSRMGFDKSTVDYHGIPQSEYLFNLLNQFCGKVYTSCKKGSSIPSTLNPLYDSLPVESPINGILTAFAQHKTTAWLTVPVDMPFIDSKTIALLIEHRDVSAAATCFYDSEGKLPEPLITIWEPSSFPELRKSYTDGNISPRKFLMASKVKMIRHPDSNFNSNVNSQEELTRIKNILKDQ